MLKIFAAVCVGMCCGISFGDEGGPIWSDGVIGQYFEELPKSRAAGKRAKSKGGEGMSKMKTVAVNEKGRRVGESHPRAKLSDHEVDLLRELVEELIASGMRPMEAYRQTAEKFELHVVTVKGIVRYAQRSAVAVRLKRVKVA
jgi:hypothetical protein